MKTKRRRERLGEPEEPRLSVLPRLLAQVGLPAPGRTVRTLVPARAERAPRAAASVGGEVKVGLADEDREFGVGWIPTGSVFAAGDGGGEQRHGGR
jgi:hypothetical protein